VLLVPNPAHKAALTLGFSKPSSSAYFIDHV